MVLNSKEFKVFGIGLSKTGTQTLHECYRILDLLPRASYDKGLQEIYNNTGDANLVLTNAHKFRSFENNPWFKLYKECDVLFPGSKFILTTRINLDVYLKSAWFHQIKRERVTGNITSEFIEKNTLRYSTHNFQVRDYFQNRPNDLLEVCWEKGESNWEVLCDFLELPVPSEPFPYRNKGIYWGEE